MIGHHALIGAVSRVAAAAAWTPASLGASLYTWNRHTSLPASGSITTWADSGSGIATAVAVGSPTAATEANGLRYATLNGTSQYFVFAGNPAGAVPGSIDVRGVTIGGLIRIATQPQFSPTLWAGAVFGGPSGVRLHSGYASDEQVSLDLRASSAVTAGVDFFMGNDPRSWQGGTSASPVVAPTAITFASTGQALAKNQWLPFVLHLPATSAARLMIGSRANVVAQATGAQNLAVPVKYLGARYQPAASAVNLFFAGALSEFFGFDAAAADDATIDTVFAYLNGLKP